MWAKEWWPRAAQAKAALRAEGWGCGEPGPLEPFPPTCLPPRGIFKAAHTYDPVSWEGLGAAHRTQLEHAVG